MAAAVNLTSTTMEGQLIELIQAANAYERSLPEDQNEERYSLALDLDANPPQVTLSATVNVSVTNGASGLTISAQNYPAPPTP
ncbi:hypothetical protein [Leptolyngbya sp. 7M]|uniref:hypothetical protein n=1 Tax=Leptolyngbya sp. 7M TaxID=2812896 RepID=UPI001B8C74EC|nr:hypothetical protein [Leptolyngbya sp. 7M]QYO68200.1 hypothetical protein JVX88_16405 [Leptolyngbya sp. 7M]